MSRDLLETGSFQQLNLYTTDFYGLPDELFWHPEINWHHQQFGVKGLIAAAGLWIRASEATITAIQSDLCQQLYRHATLRAQHKIQVERHFKYWYAILFNAVLDLCLLRGISVLYSPTGRQVVASTRKRVRPDLFLRIYDYPNLRYLCRRTRRHEAEYWEIPVEPNSSRIVRLRQVDSVPRRDKGTRPKICIFHDIEENVDTSISAAECSDNLDRMLRIEQEFSVDATYDVLGCLLGRKKETIQASNPRHSIAFHSFNHQLDDLMQLQQCREVDLRIRGYRPPRSRITSELTDYNLSFFNFEWVASSASSLRFDRCKLENGLVKIPIDLDDYPLFTDVVDYERWERNLLESAQGKSFFAFGLHDCYAGCWLARYPQLLHKLAEIGDFLSADQLCDATLLGESGTNFLSSKSRASTSDQPGRLTRRKLHPEAASRPIKILVIIPNLDIGGAEMDLLRNLPHLEPSRFTPVVYPIFWEGPLAAQLTAQGVEIVDVAKERETNPRDWISRSCRFLSRLLPNSRFVRRLASIQEYIHSAQSIARYMDEAEVDVIHAILPGPYLAAVLANALTKRRPLVMSRVSLNWYHREKRLFGVIERFFLHPRIDAAIANSQAALGELRAEGIPEDKLRLIYNGIDAAAFVSCDVREARSQLGISSDAVVFSSVSNLHTYKGHSDLLKALSLISDWVPENWRLLVAGQDVNGSLDELRRLTNELGLSKNVRLLGQRQDIPTILSAADIHVSASHHESFPNNILEAMCADLPVVATSVGGVPEQVIDGTTGILVPPRDPLALSKALLLLASKPNLRTEMGARGQDRVREFSIARSVLALEQTYASVAKITGPEGDRSTPLWRANGQGPDNGFVRHSE